MKLRQLYRPAVEMLLWLRIMYRVGVSAQRIPADRSSRVDSSPVLYPNSNAFMQLGIRADKAMIGSILDTLNMEAINKGCDWHIMHRLQQFMAYARERPREFSIQTDNGRIKTLSLLVSMPETYQYLADMHRTSKVHRIPVKTLLIQTYSANYKCIVEYAQLLCAMFKGEKVVFGISCTISNSPPPIRCTEHLRRKTEHTEKTEVRFADVDIWKSHNLSMAEIREHLFLVGCRHGRTAQTAGRHRLNLRIIIWEPQDTGILSMVSENASMGILNIYYCNVQFDSRHYTVCRDIECLTIRCSMFAEVLRSCNKTDTFIAFCRHVSKRITINSETYYIRITAITSQAQIEDEIKELYWLPPGIESIFQELCEEKCSKLGIYAVTIYVIDCISSAQLGAMIEWIGRITERADRADRHVWMRIADSIYSRSEGCILVRDVVNGIRQHLEATTDNTQPNMHWYINGIKCTPKTVTERIDEIEQDTPGNSRKRHCKHTH